MCYSNNDEHRISSNVGSSGARQYNIATKNSSIPGKDKYLSLKNHFFAIWKVFKDMPVD